MFVISGPTAILPEHAPRDEAAKLEESRGEINFHVISNSLTEKVPKQVTITVVIDFYLISNSLTKKVPKQVHQQYKFKSYQLSCHLKFPDRKSSKTGNNYSTMVVIYFCHLKFPDRESSKTGNINNIS